MPTPLTTGDTTMTSIAQRNPPKTGMRLVIGIDDSAAGEYALELARRLDFRVPQHYVLVNAVESVWPDGTFPPFRQGHPLASELEDREAAGMARLKVALPKIADRDDKAEELQAHGEPSGILMRIAREEEADLVVVGRNRRDAIDDCLLGSVARSLLRECPQHVLVARPSAEPIQEINAVIATDDSPESNRCVLEFIRIAPKGLHKVSVLIVNEIDSAAAAMRVRGLPHLEEKAERWIEEGLERDGRQLCERLEKAGFDAEPLVVEGGDTVAAISRACDAKHASLVVVAARPHGFWDRLLNGSVSEGLFERDSRSLLVLRP